MIKAIVIDPFAKDVYVKEMENSLEGLLRTIGEGCTMVDTCRMPVAEFGRNHIMWLDDEGLLHGCRHGWQPATYPQPIMGRCVITGTTLDGDMADADCTPDQVRQLVLHWFEGDAPEPKIEIIQF